MRRKHKDSEASAPGQDSFLDIVANLVGILIILIMVVGLRTKDALVQASQAKINQQAEQTPASPAPDPEAMQEPAPLPAIDDALNEIEQSETLTEADVESAKQLAASVEASVMDLAEKQKRLELEVDYRKRERDRIQLLITAAERKLAEKREKLSAQRQQELQQQQALAEAQRKIDDLRTQLQALDAAKPQVERLDHLPTPMAKTVFGKEVHFRMHRGRLAFVPWDELVARLKEDAPNRVWKLKDAPRITETIGPLDGFRLRYTLKKSEQMVRTDAGTAMQQRVSLAFFHLIPIQDELGEPIQQAIDNPSSQLNNVIGGNDPKTTTITVWVYPDSFEAFRTLKQYLFQRGFLCASRPMPEGRYMGGAPDGSRSASQ